MAFLKYAIQDGKPIPHSDVEHTGGGKSQTRKEPVTLPRDNISHYLAAMAAGKLRNFMEPEQKKNQKFFFLIFFEIFV